MKWFRRKSKLEKFYIKNERIINYTLASMICTAILYGLFFVVDALTNGNYIIANLVAYSVSFTLLYILDQEIFKARPSKRRERVKQLYRYIISRAFGFVIDTIILFVLIDKLFIVNFLAKVFSSLMVFTYNYYMNKLYVFRDKNSAI